jgi:hypothetical protein
VDENSILKPEARSLFINRCNAIKHYFAEDTHYTNTATLGVPAHEVVRLAKRCLSTHPDGRIYGFRALIPGSRLKAYTRKSKVIADVGQKFGWSGVFTSLLNNNPEIADLIERNVYKSGRRSELFESKVSVKHLHKLFLDECRSLGLELSKAYPFNTVKCGYGSLAKYVLKLQQDKPLLAAKANFTADAVKKLSTSDGSERPVTRAFQRVECDAHHIDAIFCILVPSIFGELIPKIIKRLWVIVVQEVISKAVLGYHLSIREECNSDDVLQAIKASLTTWVPRQLTIPQLQYHVHAGFPSSFNQRLSGVIWDEFSVDQALANLSSRVASKLDLISNGNTKALVVNRHIPDDRPFVERFFKTLEEGGFHRLPNTTGNGKDDPRRKNPELAACKYFIQFEHLEEIIDVLIANYNATPHSSIGQRSPLEYLNYLTSADTFNLRYADVDEVSSLMAINKKVIVKGSLKEGRRPYINFYGVKYSSDSLRRAYHLIGKSITVEADIKDLRVLHAYSPQGAAIGSLTAATPWHLTPHSLLMRQTINSLVTRKMIHFTSNSDPIRALLDYLEKSIHKGGGIPPVYLEARRILSQDLCPANDKSMQYGEVENKLETKKTKTLPKGLQQNKSDSAKLPPPRKIIFA